MAYGPRELQPGLLSPPEALNDDVPLALQVASISLRTLVKSPSWKLFST